MAWGDPKLICFVGAQGSIELGKASCTRMEFPMNNFSWLNLSIMASNRSRSKVK